MTGGSGAAPALRDAVRWHRRGELQRAEAAYRAILQREPAHPAALHGVGLLALQAGRADLAIGYIGQAARLVPDSAAYHLDLGIALRERGHLEPARAALHVAALLRPGEVAAWAAMAEILVRLGRLPEAEAAFRTAAALAPGRAELAHGLGVVLLEQGRPEAAEAALRAALALAPGQPDMLNNLGLALQDRPDPVAALAAFQRAVAAAPDDPDIRNNLGVALRDLRRDGEALACFEAVLDRRPDHAPAHLNAASILLTQGEWARGWEALEWRDRVPGAVPRPSGLPRWDGSPLAGRRLLIQAEMGFGDTIQFCRLVREIEGAVTLAVPAALLRLLRDSLHPAVVSTAGAAGAFDVQIPLLSLPRLLRIEPSGLDPAPYLRAAPRRLDGSGLRVGVCWAGSAAYRQDRARSLPAERVAALAGPGRTLIGLQKGMPAPAGVLDLAAELGDFADTAALIAALDVVVSVDTAVAHLAGALGTPVLLLDRFAGDWRWGRGRAETPWYPTMRILRQAAPGDWDGVLAEAAALLSRSVRR